MRKFISMLLTVFMCLSVLFLTLGTMKADKALLNAVDIAEKLFESNSFEEENSSNIRRSTAKYIKGFDDNEDFIIVESDVGGYAIFEKSTYDLIEYSPIDKSPYLNVSSTNSYYAGPSQYFKKENMQIKHVFTNQTIAENEKLKISSGFKEKYSEVKQNRKVSKSTIQSRSLIGNIDDAHDAFSYNVISNKFVYGYEFFIGNGFHGENLDSTCSSVATQLLLAYNNWYHDGRIIPQGVLPGNKKFLHDDYNAYQAQPYSDARKMTTSEYNAADNITTFYEELVSKINPNIQIGAPLNFVDSKIEEYLDSYANEVQATVSSTDTIIPNDIYDIIKTEVNNNRPLLTGIHYMDEGVPAFHTVVAYGYQTILMGVNEIEGVIAHFGWGDWSSCMWFEKGWLNGYLTFTISHQHLDVVIENEGNDIETDMTVGDNGGFNHVYKCEICNRTMATQIHNWSYETLKFPQYDTPQINMSHIKKCEDCGLSIKERHAAIKYSPKRDGNGYKHRSYCKCGHNWEEDCEIALHGCIICGGTAWF